MSSKYEYAQTFCVRADLMSLYVRKMMFVLMMIMIQDEEMMMMMTTLMVAYSNHKLLLFQAPEKDHHFELIV